MSKLDDLINKFCPDGVEYKALGEVAKNETIKNKGQKCNLAYSITKDGLIPTLEYFKDKKVTSDDTSGYKIVKKNWFVYSPSRIDVGSINYLRNQEEVIVSPLNIVFSIDEQAILPNFLLYYLLSHKGMFQILNHRQGIEGTGRKMLPFENFAKIRIPVPPVEVQNEIVRILNKFTLLENELEAELEARRKQYEYYRDLLTEQNQYELVALANITSSVCIRNKGQKCKLAYSITKGGLIPTSEYFKDIIVTSDDTSGYKIVKKNWFVYSPSRIDVGSINFHRKDEDVIVSPLNVVFKIDEDRIEPKYLLFFLLSHKGMFQILNKRLGIEGTGRKMLPYENFSKIKIPLPSLSEQQRIVSILNHFESLCNDINYGLPAEIEARHKQYEYYRDKLLNFKKKDA